MTADLHGSSAINYSGEVLAGQGEMGFSLTAVARLCYRPGFDGSRLHVGPVHERAAGRCDAAGICLRVVLALVLGID
jgi:hypothetical protein